MKNAFFLIAALVALLTSAASAQEARGRLTPAGQIPDSLYGIPVILTKLGKVSGINPATGCPWTGFDFSIAEVQPDTATPAPPASDSLLLDLAEKIRELERQFLELSTPPSLPSLDIKVECCDTIEKAPVLSTVQTNWFVGLDGTLPTDREFKAFTPIVRAGWEVATHLEKYPALEVGFQVAVVTIPSAFMVAENCGSCIPQDSKGLFGAQVRMEARWSFAPKTTLVVYGRTATWLPIQREVKTLPDAGWGAELEWGKPNAMLKPHVGFTKNTLGTTPYVGFKTDLWGKSRMGPVFKPARLKRA